ncbi:hypothetical protein Droror1_Dr00016565 [Drosera rotundifolia]
MRGAEVRADEVTVMKVISACSHFGDWELADEIVKYVEEEGVEVNVYLWNTLIDMYGKRDLVELAQRMFDGMWEKNAVSWNALITGQAKVGSLKQAMRLFDEKPKRDVVSWTSMSIGYSQVWSPLLLIRGDGWWFGVARGIELSSVRKQVGRELVCVDYRAANSRENILMTLFLICLMLRRNGKGEKPWLKLNGIGPPWD